MYTTVKKIKEENCLITEEQSTLKAIRSGNTAEFEKLFRQFYEELCSYLKFFIKDNDDIEELVQETFLHIWEQRQNFYPKGSIKSYLYKAVKNKAVNYRKHLFVRMHTAERISLLFHYRHDGVEKTFDNAELLKVLYDTIEKLPARCREVFVLLKLNEFSYKETAEIMHISTKTVEVQLSIAVKKLRSLLKPYISEYK